MIKLYGKTLLFRRGKMLNINLLYECNLSCSYCSLEMPTGIRPKAKRVGLGEWKDFINDFTSKNKIREVYVSGGEPSIVKYMPELVNWLIGKGFHVLMFSNLYNPDRILQINKSYRFKVQATYHQCDDLKRFDEAYKKVIKKHRVDVDEIGYQSLSYSKVKPFMHVDDLKLTEFRVSPDLVLYDSCFNHYTDKSK